jgi:hypothetical protein
MNISPINPFTCGKDKVIDLWSKVKDLDYIFDDTTRGHAGIFLKYMFNEGVLFLELGDFGLLVADDIRPFVSCGVHYCIWDTSVSAFEVRAVLRDALTQLFDSYNLHRINAVIPEGNTTACRMANSLGFKVEGLLREAYLSHGKYQNLEFYGLFRESL